MPPRATQPRKPSSSSGQRPKKKGLQQQTNSSSLETNPQFIIPTILEIDNVEALQQFSQSIKKDDLCHGLLAQSASAQSPHSNYHHQTSSARFDRLNQIFTHLSSLLVTETQLSDSQATDQDDGKTTGFTKETETRVRLAVLFLDVYRQICGTANPTKQAAAARQDEETKPVEGLDVLSILALTPSVRAMALFVLKCWCQLGNDSEFQLQCGKVFDFISRSYPSDRVQFGSAYVLYLLLQPFSPQGMRPLHFACLLKSRDILTLIDFDAEASDCLRTHLIKSFSSSAFLHDDSGRRFLSFVLGSLQPELTVEIMEWLKTVIPNFQVGTPMLKSLSLVFHGGWKVSEGGIKLALEQCIEDLVELAILCEPKIASKMREVLFEFYRKGDDATADFVCRAISPLLYRFIPVACWKVRFNATALFAVIVPVVDASLPPGDYEAEIERQYSTLTKLVLDAHPEVRRVAVQGVCRVLVTHWEMIPLEKITQLLDSLLRKAALDRSSPHVRAAVFEGLTLILENPITHAALRSLLPHTIADSIHDPSPLVRRSVAVLLKRISQQKDFPVTSIVSVSCILARLTKDKILSELELTATTARVKTDSTSSVSLKRKLWKSDAYVSALTLGEVMFDSIFGLGELPNQVERVLLMAEKFPLALIAVVELTGCQLPILDRVRLSSALFKIASGKFSDVLQMNLDENPERSRRQKKHGTIAKVLFSIVALLLSSIEGEEEKLLKTSHQNQTTNDANSGLRKKRKPIAHKNSPPQQIEETRSGLSSVSTSRFHRSRLGGELAEFIRSNFTEQLLTPLVDPQSFAMEEALQLIASIPVVLTNVPKLEDMIARLLDHQLSLCLEASQRSRQTHLSSDAATDSNSPSTPAPLHVVGSLLECLSCRAVNDELLHRFVTDYFIQPMTHYCIQFRALCGLSPLGDEVAAVTARGCESAVEGGDLRKPVKRQKRVATRGLGRRVKGKRQQAAIGENVFNDDEDETLSTAFNEQQHQLAIRIVWNIRTDASRLKCGLEFMRALMSLPELHGVLFNGNPVFVKVMIDVLNTVKEFLLLPSLTQMRLQMSCLSTLHGGDMAETIVNQLLAVIPNVSSLVLRCMVHHAIKAEQAQLKRRRSNTSQTETLSPDCSSEDATIGESSPSLDPSQELLKQVLTLNLSQISLHWIKLLMECPSKSMLAEEASVEHEALLTEACHETQMTERCVEQVSEILRNLFPNIGVAAMFQIIAVNDSTQLSSNLQHFLQLGRIVELRLLLERGISQGHSNRNFDAAMSFVMLIKGCGALSIIQLFELLEALIFGMPAFLDIHSYQQRLTSLLPLTRSKTLSASVTLVSDCLERMDDRLTKLMKDEQVDVERFQLLSSVLQMFSDALPQPKPLSDENAIVEGPEGEEFGQSAIVAGSERREQQRRSNLESERDPITAVGVGGHSIEALIHDIDFTSLMAELNSEEEKATASH